MSGYSISPNHHRAHVLQNSGLSEGAWLRVRENLLFNSRNECLNCLNSSSEVLAEARTTAALMLAFRICWILSRCCNKETDEPDFIQDFNLSLSLSLSYDESLRDTSLGI